ncbi:uncharacterized protein LOC111273815 isoform X1 [Varroa jacobsoni]|uniref:uncharacterized protein LOC111273815 isoform X1 n=1 Tax=Varroa jacobsoni TaxID=62625 RepID=UPI000BF8F2F7|nr:uncharacterized protein LOC111273815 isoform X1 [Varroa jacobsoni]
MNNINTARSFSGRTKSLREKFASKRSYSEIFKPDVVKEATSKVRGNSRPRCSLQVASQAPIVVAPSSSPYALSPHSGGTQSHQGADGGGSSSMSPGSGGPSTGNTTPCGGAKAVAVAGPDGLISSSYHLSDTATYGSALDINSERESPRFPWQRDVAVQCCMDNEDATDNHLSIRIPSKTNSCTSSIDASSGCFSFESMQRLLDLSISSSAQQSNSPSKSALYLGISNATTTTAGRDGKLGVSLGGFQLNLPSPNVHGPESHDHETMFRRLSGKSEVSDDEDEPAQDPEPPRSALHRRRALVPPKLICTDGYDNVNVSNGNEDPIERRRSSSGPVEACGACEGGPGGSSPSGDLLVYSKVLTQRSNIITQAQQEVDGSTQSLMAVASEESGRKGRNSWSLLRIFDRNHRGKSDSITGLEEVLAQLRPSEFDDEQLSRYKGLQWSDFVALQTSGSTEGHTAGECGSPGSPEPTGTFSYNTRHQQPQQQGSPSSVSRCTSTSVNSNTSSKQIPSPSQNPAKATSIFSMEGVRKKEAMWDLFQSECMFLYDHLMVLKNVFMEPLKKIQVEGYAMFAEPEVLFGNLDELCCVTYGFCKEFILLLSTDSVSTGDMLLKLFTKSCKVTAMRQAYHRYTLNYINALNYLETLRRQIEFVEFEKWCYKDVRCKKLQLPDLLVSPVQHIMRVPLVLRKIESRSDEDQERAAIGSILEAEENSLRELDDKMKWLKNFERLLEIQRNIVWPSVTELDAKTFVPEFLKPALSRQPCEKLIVSPKRQIVLEGILTLMDGGRPSECYLILFDDMILITRRKRALNKKKSTITDNWVNCASAAAAGGGSGTVDVDETSGNVSGGKYVVYKQPLSLDRVCIHDVLPQDATANNLRNAFVFVCLNRFQQVVNVHTFQAQNETSKLLWLGRLQDTVDHWKRTLQSTVFKHRPSTVPSECVSISGGGQATFPRRST